MIRWTVLGAAVGVAILRAPEGTRDVPGYVRYLSDPDTPADDLTREDRAWAAFAAREQLGRGPVGYVDEDPGEVPDWRYARACYYLSPTIIVPGRSAARVVVNRADGPVVEAGSP